MNEYLPLIRFFTDPVLLPSTLGTMLMGFSSALLGVLIYIRKRALLGEAISHATYPGIVVAVALLAPLFSDHNSLFFYAIFFGAFLSGWIGLKVIEYLERQHQVSSDAALCFVLSSFLGVGVLFASRMQFTLPVWYQKVQMFLYGQASTMLLSHMWLYGLLAIFLLLFMLYWFPEIKASHFDLHFAKVTGIYKSFIDTMIRIFLIVVIVLGIRSVGVVLMAGMLIAPAVSARQFSRSLGQMFLFSSLFGLLSAFLGNYLSLNVPIFLAHHGFGKVVFPTGPMILIVAFGFALFALLFARERGLVIRKIRRGAFHRKCARENLLKYLYKEKGEARKGKITSFLHLSPLFFLLLSYLLKREKMITSEKGVYKLTERGFERAKRIVRLHRLWEVYLFSYLDVDIGKVHASADEMEHIITPELEKKLNAFLGDPKKDPHNQMIPEA